MKWIGIDVGGTFTDLVLYDTQSGTLSADKVASTPADPSAGILAGIARLGLDLSHVEKLAHGTTVATNTILERTGAKTAVLTTRGFRDVLEVGRGNRTILYNVKATRPPPLVPRSLVFEIDERTLYDGTLARPINHEAVAEAAARLTALGIEAVAICFLHAYANDTNERAAREAVEAALPQRPVSISSEVLPEYREYERFTATMLNAYVAPRMRRYVEALQTGLEAQGFRRDIAIMTSSGGAWPVRRIIEQPAGSVLSGPAAGVIATSLVGGEAGHRNLITYDMGGTSTDTCLIREGAFAVSTEGRIGPHPLKLQQIEINSIGAGAGSIAFLDAGGAIAVGPRSAGAVPGPAAYGMGGMEPTVTDANLVLGRLGNTRRLGGEIALDTALAAAAVDRLATRVGLDRERMAEGIIAIVVARMTASIKEISIMRGHDPREFALFAYGGAGPLHAALVADELGCRRVLVPPLPGNFSAFGLLVADVRHDLSRTRVVPTAELGFDELQSLLATMREEGRRRLASDGFAPERTRFEARLDMRFLGQAFELSVPVPEDAQSMADIEKAFLAAYERRYAHAPPGAVEIVTFRLAAFGLVRKPALPAAPAQGSRATATLAERPVVFDGQVHASSVYDRALLPTGTEFRGPAVVEELGSTTLVPPRFVAAVDPHGLLVIERR